MDTWIDMVKEIGVPTAILGVVGVYIFKLIQFLKDLIREDIKDLSDSIDNLTKKIRELQDDIVRLEVLVSLQNDKPLSMNRIAKRNLKDDSDAID
jgi:hypothetical protein